MKFSYNIVTDIFGDFSYTKLLDWSFYLPYIAVFFIYILLIVIFFKIFRHRHTLFQATTIVKYSVKILVFIFGLGVTVLGINLLTFPYMFSHFIGGFATIFGFQIIFYLFNDLGEREDEDEDSNLPRMPHSR